MKNLFVVLICFAFSGVALQAQTDSSIPGDAIGTYTLFGSDATVVVTATDIVGNTGGNSVAGGSGTTSGSGATSGAGASDTSSDDGSSAPAVGLHSIRKAKQGGWGGTYTTEDGKNIPVMLQLVQDAKGRRGILAVDRSGTIVARYQRG